MTQFPSDVRLTYVTTSEVLNSPRCECAASMLAAVFSLCRRLDSRLSVSRANQTTSGR